MERLNSQEASAIGDGVVCKCALGDPESLCGCWYFGVIDANATALLVKANDCGHLRKTCMTREFRNFEII